jgi:hypothetical protein
MVAPIGRDSAEFTVLAIAGEAPAAGVRRGGDATRAAGANVAISAADLRAAAARTLSGCTFDGEARAAFGAAFKFSGGVGVRCAAGT